MKLKMDMKILGFVLHIHKYKYGIEFPHKFGNGNGYFPIRIKLCYPILEILA
jgi:hypothetical protein